jgi:thiosulfate/3-mercaptopyruvate sulfurtransferase
MSRTWRRWCEAAGLALLAAAVGCARRGAAPGEVPTPTAAAGVARLLGTDSLAAWSRREQVLLVDVRPDPFAYLEAHLPGAVYLNTETLRAAQGGVPMQLLADDWYRGLFSRIGIRWDRPVVVYSAGESRNIDATFLVWLLRSMDHPAVYLLDGGYARWKLEQRPLTQRYPALTPAPAAGAPFRPPVAFLEDVRRAVAGHGATLVDARSPEQYAGAAGAQVRRGHIPGAVNHYWQDDLEQVGFGRVWKGRERLRAAYAAQGITPDKDLILYCNSTTEATHVYFALHDLLGYPKVRIYTGAWTEWAAREDLPIAAGPTP